MPDVSISNLPTRVPVNTDVIPCSTGTETYRASISQINSLASSTPTGTVIMWTTSTPPAGYLECNGAAISRSTYSALFSILGTIYGIGNGSTTFNLPDLRGQFVRGWDRDAGVDPDRSSRTNRGDGIAGNNIGTKQTDALQNITGSYFGESRGNATGAFADVYGGDGGFNGAGFQPTSWDFDASRVVRTSTETRPTNIYLMFCIKT